MRAHNVRERYRSLENWICRCAQPWLVGLIPAGADNHGAAALRNFLHGTQFTGEDKHMST